MRSYGQLNWDVPVAEKLVQEIPAERVRAMVVKDALDCLTAGWGVEFSRRQSSVTINGNDYQFFGYQKKGSGLPFFNQPRNCSRPHIYIIQLQNEDAAENTVTFKDNKFCYQLFWIDDPDVLKQLKDNFSIQAVGDTEQPIWGDKKVKVPVLNLETLLNRLGVQQDQ